MNNVENNQELVALYLSECEQMILKFEKLIMETEQKSELTNAAELFRILHTLKGSSAMMQFAPLVELSHDFEEILAVIKSGQKKLSEVQLSTMIDLGLAFVLYFREQLSGIKAGVAPQRQGRLSGEIKSFAMEINTTVKSATVPKTVMPVENTQGESGEHCVLVKLKSCPIPHIRASLIMKSVSNLCESLRSIPERLDQAAQYSETILKDGFRILFVPTNLATNADIIQKLSAQPYVISCTEEAIIATGSIETTSVPKDEMSQQVTVAQSLVNRLIDYMGEVAVAENALESFVRSTGNESRQLDALLATLHRAIADANLVASEIGLHDVGSVFLQMQHTVRNMARDIGKEIKLKTSGDDVQVDKSILDILSDSLIHIIRNAVDHGIETPQVRAGCGKSKTGYIMLSAEKNSDYLTVRVSDDGAGINRQAVLDRAEQKGKLTKPKEKYTYDETCNLLLSSGISTNADVTQYSGRGVGLDAVMRRVKQVGGWVSVTSEEGVGSTFVLKIPITLMVIDGIDITIDNNQSLIVPAHAVHHISFYEKFDKQSDKILFQGNQYALISLPCNHEAVVGSGYALLLEKEYGYYYLRASHVSPITTYYVKALPEFIADTLGQDNFYAGCVLGTDFGLRTVLDIEKLINYSKTKVKAEGIMNL